MNKKKVPTIAKILLILLAVIVILAAVAFGFFEYSFSKLNTVSASSDSRTSSSSDMPEAHAPSAENAEKSEDELLLESFSSGADSLYSSKDITNILLIGVDNDNIGGIDARGDADGLILVSINNKSKKIAVTSILREVYIEPAEGQGNEATLVYHYYGLEKLIVGIEKALNVKIDNYMLFNYLDIIDIVDSLGGVDIELYNGEIQMLNQKVDSINFQLLNNEYENAELPEDTEGLTHLNGIQTAGYMRIRLSDQTNNDFGRTQRIRNVIMAMKNKALALSLLELYSFVNATLPNITTDLTQGQTLSLMSKAISYKSYDIVSGRIPVDDSYETIDSAQHIDYEVNREYFMELIS